MSDALLWYVVVTLLGWLTFPLAFSFFRHLPDRGYAFSRSLGLLLWGYVFWLMTSLHLTANRSEGIVFALVVVLALSLTGYIKVGKKRLLHWWQENRAQVAVMEGLFALAFAALAGTRAANPEALGTEKPMELAFINAILRSETFPPHDPWLSGYAISYYYFGYVLVAMLAKFCGTSGAVAFNLGICLIFALSALGAYGLLNNLLCLQFGKRFHWKPLLAPLLVLLVGNLGGLLEVLHAAGLFWQQRNGMWVSSFWKWLDLVELSQPPQPPFDGLPKRWYWWWRASRVVQDYDVSGAPREIIDEFPAFSYLLADLHPHVLAMPFALLAVALALNLWGGWRSHPPFPGTARLLPADRAKSLRYPLHIPFGESLLAALILGGMAFLNTWDFPIYVGLCAAAYAWGRNFCNVRQSTNESPQFPQPVSQNLSPEASKGASAVSSSPVANGKGDSLLSAEAGTPLREILTDFFLFGLWTGIWGIFFYLPFYLGFSSQAGGFLPNLVYPTRGAHLWVMFAPLFIPILVWLGWHFRQILPQLRRAIGWSMILLSSLWIVSLAMGLLISNLPAVGGLYLGTMGAATLADWLPIAIYRRLLFAGGWMTLGILLSGALALLFSLTPPSLAALGRSTAVARQAFDPPSLAGERVLPNPAGEGQTAEPKGFVALMILVATLLVIFPEFFYLRDQFGWRMNTVFKFYYQAWLIWAIAAAFALAWIPIAATSPRPPLSEAHASKLPVGKERKQRATRTFHAQKFSSLWVSLSVGVSLLVLLSGLVYTVLATLSKTNNFRPPEGFTLDSTAYLWRQNPNEMQAIAWLSQAPLGVVAEAVSPSGGSYSQYARVGTLSGQPIVLGWTGHESQWRGGASEMGNRQADLERLYCTRSLEEAQQIIAQYHIRYVFVGELERSTYRPNNDTCPGGLYEAKFQRAFIPIYQVEGVAIYQTP